MANALTMPDIVNPRRGPRAPFACEARGTFLTGSFFVARTTDYGPQGCQLDMPRAVAPGVRILVELANVRVPGHTELSGRVAWSAKVPPWRIGVAFDHGSLRTAGHLFERLAVAYPDVPADSRALEKISEDTFLAPAPPPGLAPIVSAEELMILRAVGAGIRADALRAKLGERWHACINPVFGLLARQYLVTGLPDERAAAGWASLISQTVNET